MLKMNKFITILLLLPFLLFNKPSYSQETLNFRATQKRVKNLNNDGKWSSFSKSYKCDYFFVIKSKQIIMYGENQKEIKYNILNYFEDENSYNFKCLDSFGNKCAVRLVEGDKADLIYVKYSELIICFQVYKT